MSRKQRIEDLLMSQLAPVHLSVENESHRHHVPEGAETHFKVIAVSDQFTSLNRVARHRLLNRLLADELQTGLHALSLHLYTPAEWQEKEGKVMNSPACRDGYRHG
ncbi:BolA/IbaG family iron-sulfur metabolism protein [Legionella sp. MW5194]|uniref:BolA family protein n=1 Tax=Legionella sp. MW5194 TaxID=2662448 RepID=UPI00193CD689|nr:BolA family protein [Legionella sp. MW5194]QRN03244.1 BolA/IbaG family iron-sulfur metabolism protein [Legionella sp. MW5194]